MTVLAERDKLRRITDQDLPQLLQLNNGAVPAVNELDETALKDLLAEAELAVVAARGEDLSGFLLAFGPGVSYQSSNYRWFDARFPDFLYIDRIVIAPQRRGRGIGRRLYEAAFAHAKVRPLCCEVNLRPPNERSLSFHRALGFQQLAEEESHDGKLVAMLATQPLPDRGR